MDTHTARAIDGGLNAPLDKRQMALLCMAARAAWDVQVKMGLVGEEIRGQRSEVSGQKSLTSDLRSLTSSCREQITFELWRHREQLRVIGVSSLRVARQRHYRPMLSHWQDLQGRPMEALASRQRGLLDADHQARAALQAECIEAGEWFGSAADARQYAAGFLRHKRRVELGEAHARDIWHAVYVLRRRVCQLKRKAAREILPQRAQRTAEARLVGASAPQETSSANLRVLCGEKESRHVA